MEENNIENNLENKDINTGMHSRQNNGQSQQQIAGAIIFAGLIIAGAILLKGNSASVAPTTVLNANGTPITLAKVGPEDRVKGNPKAKVTLVMYEDFQCPFCGAVNGSESNKPLMQALRQQDPNWTAFMPAVNEYVKNGTVQFVYRDYAFLGPESIRSAEAARCAGDQGKFWEYHDYLYSHQNGESQGAFSDPNLKSFAKGLGLDTTAFNSCLDGNKYAEAVTGSKAEGDAAGVTGTPKGFILRDGKIVSTINGAESFGTVKPKIDSALK